MDLVFDASPEDIKLFIQEAEELIQQLDEDVLRLEKEGQNPELIQEIFRAAHTLKGSSGMLGHERMAELTHAMETLFDKLRKGELTVTTELIDLFLDCLDALKTLKDECITLKASDIDVKTLSGQILAFAGGKDAARQSEASSSQKVMSGGVKAENVGNKPEANGVALALDAEEIDKINRAEITGSQAFAIKVTVSQDCAMPSVRLYQVAEELQALGQIVKTEPAIEAIENGECGSDIELILVSAEDQSSIEGVIKAVSELSSYTVQLYKVSDEPGQVEVCGLEPGAQAVEDERIEDLGPEARGKSQQELNQMRAAAMKTVRVDVERLDHLMNLVGELVIGKTRLLQIGSELADNYHLGDISGSLNEVTAQIGQITNELQEEVMRARMLPIEQVFNKFPRLVRDLARSAGKQINFVVEGKETEIDRSVLEEIGDPLIHILRNAIDHGIETPEERKKAGKPAEGSIHLAARHEENHIVVEVSDDGRGIDPQKLKDKALAKGLITPDSAEKMSDRDAYELIFLSGFSTAEKVSEISGRGVGMDVVRTNIKKINGSVGIESEVGKGTKFIIKLPLTLVIVDALIVVLGKKLYAIPLSMVKEVLRLEPGDIKMVDKLETILLRGSVLPLLRLSELFGQGGATERGNSSGLHVVVVGYGETKVGLIVDHLVSKMEIMIKALGDYLGDIDGISGATILGDGKVALVVDPIALIAKVDTQALASQITEFAA
ncbi:MAG: chemotaxis protein CheA [Firmicutes bacterium]|nr:chemotaxis protein CheA [Bacillota bacterium]